MADNNEIKVDQAVINSHSNSILQINSELSGLKFSNSVERTTLTASSNAVQVIAQAEKGNSICEETVEHFISQVNKMTENYMNFDKDIRSAYK